MRRHIHECQTPDCHNYYVCSAGDGCDRDWTCPVCLDDEQAEDLNRQEQEMNREQK